MLADLTYVLARNKLLSTQLQLRIESIAPFLALYVVTLMHGSAIRLEGGGRAELFAGFRNDQRRLEVKARLTVTDLGKPITAPVCLFWTSLVADDWCDRSLLETDLAWDRPLEITKTGLLTTLA